MRFLKLAPILFLLLTISCAGADIFPAIDANMSNPIMLSINSDSARLYIVNSNYKVSYEDGSLHVVNIADPTTPTRVNYATMPSFSGAVYIDTTNELLYTPNRYSSTELDREDNLFRFDINEASSDFLVRSDYVSGDDPFGVACCDAENRMIVASQQGQLDYYDLDDSLAHGLLSMTSTLDTDVVVSGFGATRVVIFGTQAVVTRTDGGLWVVNLDQLGVSGTHPIDYFISDIAWPRGITTDGTYLYAVSVGFDANNAEVRYLYVLDISSLTPRTDNTTTELVEKDSSGIIVATVDLVTEGPQEVVLTDDNAYVSHMTKNVVSVVDLATYTKTTEFAVGSEPYGMAVYSPGGTSTHLYVANSGDGTVSAVDISTNTIIGTYP